MMVMNWDGLGDDDDQFFESLDRISSAISLEMASSGSDDDEDFEDSRISFASATSTPSDEFRSFTPMEAATSSEDYNLWMSEPDSIKERRRRLLQGMGLGGDKELLRLTSAEFMRVASKKAGSCKSSPLLVASTSSPSEKELQQTEHSHLSSPSPLCRTVLVRSRSDGNIASAISIAKRRKEQFLGVSLNHHLIRSSSGSSSSTRYRNLQLRTSSVKLALKKIINGSSNNANGSIVPSLLPNGKGGAFVLIKNLDTGKEFIVNEFDEDGMWNKLSDLQTGKQLTRDEFEKCVGYSPIVKELMRRENVSGVFDDSVGGSERKISMNPSLARSLRFSKRMGVAWLKNIRGVANSVTGFIGDKEKEHNSLMEQQSTKSSSEWMKVRQHGKSYKELTGLYMSQEIQAHQGSIWTIRFSCDAHYLASAGEDRVIHVWEVLDSDVLSLRLRDETNFTTSVHPMAANNSPDRPLLEDAQVRPSERKRRGKVSSTSKKGCSIPDHVFMPETVFSLSEKPVCSFQGHLDDVLDLSWSKNQQLLSSSMDKTVRLWDMESKTCLKLFAHNDYVTCIQFNPIDDRYFISGSLDAKVRLWSIPDRQVVDWTELHEMVTAACYTPDGQGALVGSHKGSCRIYNTSECKLSQKGQIDIQNKRKSQAKKITGFQFAPGNSYEVLITSADSRIRIFDGSDVTHKFQGFRNTSSQISASFTADGKYVVCASEDSQIYIWKRDEIRNVGGGKGKGLITTRSYEQFQCRDVSVAIPWPGSIKYEPPTLPLQSKRHSKRPILPLPASLGGALTLEDTFMRNSNRRHVPPLPSKNNSLLERTSTYPDEELSKVSSLSDSGFNGLASFASSSGSSLKYGESPSISISGHSSSLSWSSWSDSGNSNGSNTSVQATAWGLVVVAAGLGGEIKIFQNFGLPVRPSRQSNLFKDNT